MKKSAATIAPLDMEVLSKRREVILGIDPGLTGAAVVLDHGILEAARDFKELVDIVYAVRSLRRASAPFSAIVIEGVHAMPGQGVCSMFSFGTAFGVAQGAVWSECPGTEVTFVSPQKWQNWYKRHLDLGGGEFDSRHIASALFPDQIELFKREKDHNTADAALMALWQLAHTTPNGA